jgi:hypothetical protein
MRRIADYFWAWWRAKRTWWGDMPPAPPVDAFTTPDAPPTPKTAQEELYDLWKAELWQLESERLRHEMECAGKRQHPTMYNIIAAADFIRITYHSQRHRRTEEEYTVPPLPINLSQMKHEIVDAILAQPRSTFIARLDSLPLMPVLDQGEAAWVTWYAAAQSAVRYALHGQPVTTQVRFTEATTSYAPLRLTINVIAPATWPASYQSLVHDHLALVVSAALGIIGYVDRAASHYTTTSDASGYGWEVLIDVDEDDTQEVAA